MPSTRKANLSFSRRMQSLKMTFSIIIIISTSSVNAKEIFSVEQIQQKFVETQNRNFNLIYEHNFLVEQKLWRGPIFPLKSPKLIGNFFPFWAYSRKLSAFVSNILVYMTCFLIMIISCWASKVYRMGLIWCIKALQIYKFPINLA